MTVITGSILFQFILCQHSKPSCMVMSTLSILVLCGVIFFLVRPLYCDEQRHGDEQSTMQHQILLTSPYSDKHSTFATVFFNWISNFLLSIMSSCARAHDAYTSTWLHFFSISSLFQIHGKMHTPFIYGAKMVDSETDSVLDTIWCTAHLCNEMNCDVCTFQTVAQCH